MLHKYFVDMWKTFTLFIKQFISDPFVGLIMDSKLDLENKMIKIGDRVVVSGYALPVHVSRIYWSDSKGVETEFSKLAAKVMLELDWGALGKSKVALDDENKVWYRYTTSN